jgi:hypothetical protein
VLAGLRLIGLSIWERRNGASRNVTFPARQYTVNGERRSFALLRPVVDVRHGMAFAMRSSTPTLRLRRLRSRVSDREAGRPRQRPLFSLTAFRRARSYTASAIVLQRRALK